MIKYFTVENYRSIKTENILEFDATENRLAHPIIGFAGANASGKTTILRALSFVLWFMQHSFLRIDESADMPCEPFYTLPSSPTQFHLIFAPLGEEQSLDYEYQVCLTQEKVLTEELNFFQTGKTIPVYRRHHNTVQFGECVTPIDTKDLRSNCSLISFAAQFASQTIAITCKHYIVHSNLEANGLKQESFNPSLLDNWLADEKRRDRIQTALKLADVGITEIDYQAVIGDKTHFKHQLDHELVNFIYRLESAGTLQFLSVLYRIIQALEEGAVLIFDEIELKLHQNLVVYLLSLFQNPAENRHHAQLIFSFHNTYFMEFLKPSALWFAEKNDQGQTELFSAAAFTDIPDLEQKDLETLYRVGRFGAKPREI
jgi:uncharacterized protein